MMAQAMMMTIMLVKRQMAAQLMVAKQLGGDGESAGGGGEGAGD
jgi:hypothetical protein